MIQLGARHGYSRDGPWRYIIHVKQDLIVLGGPDVWTTDPQILKEAVSEGGAVGLDSAMVHTDQVFKKSAHHFDQ